MGHREREEEGVRGYAFVMNLLRHISQSPGVGVILANPMADAVNNIWTGY